MKAKLATVTLIGLAVCSLALAQSNPAGDSPASEETPAAEAQAAPAAETTSDPVAEAASDAPAAAPAETTSAVPTAITVAAAETAAAPAPAAASETGAQPGVIIPLIQYQEVPLTTAIENLTRQAGLNYILDPKVGYGQPDERGVIKPQPNISVRWENLTAEQALSALLATYGLQLVEDPKTKTARVTIKDPDAPEPLTTQVVQLKYAAPSNIVAAVQTVLTDKRSRVVADVRTSQLVVSATEKEQEAVNELVAKLDTMTKQVLIEAKLLETSQNPKTSKGIDWSATLGDSSLQMGKGQVVTFGNNSLPGVAPTPPVTYTDPITGAPNTLPGTPGSIGGILNDPKLLMNASSGPFFSPPMAFLNADGVTAVLSFLNQSADAKVIATPRAVTMDNETADLVVTRAYPIFKNTAGTQGSPGGSEVTYTNLGTILRVTPRISANDYVNLRVVPEVSTLEGVSRKVVAGTQNEADIYAIRKIETQVMIPSGNTLVLGGLMSDASNKGNTKVPVLGDLPVVGLAFRKDSKERRQANLMIFITPTIVKDTDFQPTSSTFLQSKAEDIEDKEWTAWDSGKPLDWSKPTSGKTKD